MKEQSRDGFVGTDGYLLTASCLTTAAYRLFQIGNLSEVIALSSKADQLFTRLNCSDALLVVCPYLTLALLETKSIERLFEVLPSFRLAVDNDTYHLRSLALNTYYTLCVDIREQIGLSVNEDANVNLSHLAKHAELQSSVSNCNEPSLILYCFSTVAQAFVRRQMYSHARIYFAQSIRFITKCKDVNGDWSKKQRHSRLNMNDPIVQVSLLKLVECQLIEEAMNVDQTRPSLWLIDYCNKYFTHERNFSGVPFLYPMLLFYDALRAKLEGKGQYEKLIEAALSFETSGNDTPSIVKEWIEHNIIARSHGSHRGRRPRTISDWNGDVNRITYYILPI